VTLITPVVEVDGRNRMVDVYNWHLAHPNQNWPQLVYWGHYVAHDNNRDAIGLSLKLTRNVLNTYLQWKPQVLHDLHESVPYLYDNTIGDGPYNAWVDPILTDEWQMIGWNNVSEMTKFGMPGVFAHGNFDTWSPGYLMFIAATHNGISRLYETFGNGGADTLERTLSPSEYQRTWYKQNPPLPKAKWSQRNNNNYEQTALLTSLYYFGNNSKLFLKNFYLKSKRSIDKPKNEGPAAYVLPGDDVETGQSGETAAHAASAGRRDQQGDRAVHSCGEKKAVRGRRSCPRRQLSDSRAEDRRSHVPGGQLHRPHGPAVQPHRRCTARLSILGAKRSANDIYDDTPGPWASSRMSKSCVCGCKVLQAPMDASRASALAGRIANRGSVYVINHNADNALVTLRYRLKDVEMDAAEEPFEAADASSIAARSSFAKRNGDDLRRVANELGIQVYAVADAPSVKTHPVRAARVAMMHTWLSTQDEGWYRVGLDQLQVPFAYISTQDVSREPNLKSKYDVILFAPVGRGRRQSSTACRCMATPLPWKKTQLTPNSAALTKLTTCDRGSVGMVCKTCRSL
jgi:hypothetical protein